MLFLDRSHKYSVSVQTSAWLGKLIDIMRQASSVNMNTPKNDAKPVANLCSLGARPFNSYWRSESIKCVSIADGDNYRLPRFLPL